MRRDAFDDEPWDEHEHEHEPAFDLDAASPFDLDAAAPDELRSPEDRPGRDRSRLARWVASAAAVVVLATAAGVSLYRSAEREHQRDAYDKLIALSADGEAAVASAVSQTRDVVQYAEPLLNSAQTNADTRTALLREVRSAAARSRTTIEVQRRRVAAADAPGSLGVARAATEKYLADWASVFAGASGQASPPDGVENDLMAEQDAARQALRDAAPDKHRAAQADGVLGTLGW
jgi:hypothetical protein